MCIILLLFRCCCSFASEFWSISNFCSWIKHPKIACNTVYRNRYTDSWKILQCVDDNNRIYESIKHIYHVELNFICVFLQILFTSCVCVCDQGIFFVVMREMSFSFVEMLNFDLWHLKFNLRYKTH